jgi:hypothetical protein
LVAETFRVAIEQASASAADRNSSLPACFQDQIRSPLCSRQEAAVGFDHGHEACDGRTASAREVRAKAGRGHIAVFATQVAARAYKSPSSWRHAQIRQQGLGAVGSDVPLWYEWGTHT